MKIELACPYPKSKRNFSDIKESVSTTLELIGKQISQNPIVKTSVGMFK